METIPSKISTTAKVVVATTVALSFISFWRGAAIVLSDLASSMFYAGGIAEQAIGKSAAWYVLGVMVFSFAVRAVYVESCGMFVRGGVYVVVRDSIEPFRTDLGFLARLRLRFDGPDQLVSAGHTWDGCSMSLLTALHEPGTINPNTLLHFSGYS